MPKFTYSAAKGIEQSSGSGFIINDAAIQPSLKEWTRSTDGAAPNFNTLGFLHQTISVTLDDGALNITIPNGQVIGEQKTVICAAQGASHNLTITDAAGTGHIATNPAAGAVYVFVYASTNNWKLLA